ncbi:DEKNAAC101863 [Brettanomyces naardenensis]|uniref:DEKNAAC101863 n=1 Tax=Brettanomyces naardenensis TaxID=13370 RepID=A0A448YJ82_BRENA|nr:DEKNAAC101863 [Brettanomyces naardenensis]
MAMQRGMQAMQPMRIPGRPGYIMMVPMVAQTPVTVKGGTVQPTVIDRSVVDDVYMDALNRKIASKGREDGEQQEGEAAEEEEQEAEGAEKGEGVEKEEESDDDSDSDDVEAKAIEEGAANQPNIIRGVLQISNKAYNYSVAVTGDEDEDRKHFHDVMEVVWKNYMK